MQGKTMKANRGQQQKYLHPPNKSTNTHKDDLLQVHVKRTDLAQEKVLDTTVFLMKGTQEKFHRLWIGRKYIHEVFVRWFNGGN